MRTGVKWVAVLVIVSGMSGANGAQAALSGQMFTVAGGSASLGEPVRFGRAATDVPVAADAVLGLPDGGFAYFDFEANRVLRVDRTGRVGALVGNGRNGNAGDGGPAIRAGLWWVDDLALDPRGVLIADSIGGRIRLVRPDGIIVRIAGGGARRAVDVPATSDDFEGVEGLAVTSAGDILAANGEQHWVRRISSDGIVRGFAGTGRRSGPRGDGGPATNARLDSPTSVAVAGDGGVYIAADSALRRVAADGSISTLARAFAFEQVVSTPLGTVVGGSGCLYERQCAGIGALHPDGSLTALAGDGPNSAFDGDGESGRDVHVRSLDVSPSADGGLLISSSGRIRYLPPEHPARLAVAITRPTLTSPPRLRVSVATTMPATITARVSGGVSHAPPISASVAPGDATLEFSRDLRAGGYIVRVEARGADGQVATDVQDVYVGDLLSVRAALRLAVREMKSKAAALNERGRVGRCRRYSRRRTDCQIFIHGSRCSEVASFRLHKDGLAYIRRYGAKDFVPMLPGQRVRTGCRFRRDPGGRDRPALTT